MSEELRQNTNHDDPNEWASVSSAEFAGEREELEQSVYEKIDKSKTAKGVFKRAIMGALMAITLIGAAEIIPVVDDRPQESPSVLAQEESAPRSEIVSDFDDPSPGPLPELAQEESVPHSEIVKSEIRGYEESPDVENKLVGIDVRENAVERAQEFVDIEDEDLSWMEIFHCEGFRNIELNDQNCEDFDEKVLADKDVQSVEMTWWSKGGNFYQLTDYGADGHWDTASMIDTTMDRSVDLAPVTDQNENTSTIPEAKVEIHTMSEAQALFSRS